MTLYYIAVITREEEMILRVGKDIWMFHNPDNAATVAERLYWDRRSYGRPVTSVAVIRDVDKTTWDTYEEGWGGEALK